MAGEGYRKIALSEVPNTPNPTRMKKELDEALGIASFGCNYYEADPGEQVPWGYHRHPEHEELFLVLAGELEVETRDATYRVGANEAFFVSEDAPNKARAVGTQPTRFLAVGAPKSTDDAVIKEECPTCGKVTDREYETTSDGDEYVLFCAGCGAEVMRFGT